MILTVTLNPALDLNLETPGLAFDQVSRALASHMNTGGKGVNVSRVIHENGGATRALVLVAGDIGMVFERRVQLHGFSVTSIRVSGETRINVVVADPTRGRHIKVNQAGPALTPAQWRKTLAAFGRALEGATLVTLSGSLPPGAPEDGYGQMIVRAREAGIRTILDADREALRRGIEAGAFAVKPNRAELEAWAGRPLRSPAALVAAAREMVKQGVELVLVSDGSRAAYAVTAKAVWRAIPPRVHATGVVGAGDSLVAGVAVGQDRGLGVGEALRLGVAWGAATAKAPDTALCRRADAEDLWKRVKVTEYGE